MSYTSEELSKMGYDADQIGQILDGQRKGLDVSCYMDPEMFAVCMFQIKTGLAKGLDVSIYSDMKYDWFQMEELRLGLENNVDVSVYADPKIPFDRMRRIRLGLIDGLNLCQYLNYPAALIQEIHFSMLDKVDILPFVEQGYNADQVSVIRKALADGIDVSPYITTIHQKVAIEEIVKGLKEGLDVTLYSSDRLNYMQMGEIRKGLESKVDVSLYSNPLYNWEQMKQIRMGLEEGLDVSIYKKFIYTAMQMEKIRFQLVRKKSRENASDEAGKFGFVITNSVGFKPKKKVVEREEKAWRESNQFSVEEDLEECQEMLKLLLSMKQRMEDIYSAEIRNTMELYLKVERAIYSKRNDVSIITSDLEALLGGAL